MIKLSNGHKLEYLAASGALGYDGKGYWWEQFPKIINLFDVSLFTPITKTLTYKPRKGNFRWYKPTETIKFIDGGIINAMGLGNPGFNWWYSKYRNDGNKQIVSIYSEDTLDLVSMILILNNSNAIGIEINESCPNACISSEKKIIEDCNIARKISDKPIILKLSVLHASNKNLKDFLEKIDVDAISINSVPWNIVFPDKKSPFEKFGGGAVSGKIIQPYTWNFIKELKEVTDIPIIGCSVWEYEDIQKLYDLGASAISFGGIFLRYPWKPTKFIRKYENMKIENMKIENMKI